MRNSKYHDLFWRILKMDADMDSRFCREDPKSRPVDLRKLLRFGFLCRVPGNVETSVSKYDSKGSIEAFKFFCGSFRTTLSILATIFVDKNKFAFMAASSTRGLSNDLCVFTGGLFVENRNVRLYSGHRFEEKQKNNELQAQLAMMFTPQPQSQNFQRFQETFM